MKKRERASALLKDHVVVVTGGSSGNGRAIALRAAEEGAKAIVIVDLHERPREGGRSTKELVSEFGVKTEFAQADVAVVEELEAAIAVSEQFGGVTCMVNNAGILQPQRFLDVKIEDFERIMAVNSRSVFFGSQIAARSMLDGNRTGSIVNVSSLAGLVGASGLSAYSASKGAVKLLTYSLAAELGPSGIRVNAVHPGVIETAMTTADADIANKKSALSIPLRRNGTPEDVANAVVYLGSDLSSFVSGASLVVDGGVYTTSS